MKSPLFLLLAGVLASPCLGAQGASGKIPTDPGPTAAGLANMAADSSYEGQRRAYDGATPVRSSSGFTLGHPIGPKVGGGAPTAGPAATAAPAVPKAKEVEKPPFLDDQTIGFAALGVLAGGIIGIALIGSLGFLGPLLGAIVGAALLVGIWKMGGYKKPEKK